MQFVVVGAEQRELLIAVDDIAARPSPDKLYPFNVSSVTKGAGNFLGTNGWKPEWQNRIILALEG
jgi:hypothetical protein